MMEKRNDYLKDMIEEFVKEEIEKQLLVNNTNSIKILGRKEIEEILNCKRSRFQEIASEKYYELPIVTIGRNIYTTELQLVNYLEKSTKKYIEYRNYMRKKEQHSCIKEVLNKKDLMNIFGMGEKKFKKFADLTGSPIEFKLNQYYSTVSKLQKWFFENERKKIVLK